MGAGFDFLMDGLITFFGLYLIYSAFIMKRNGTIPPVILSKDRKVEKDSDISGFIGYMYGKTMLVGVCTTVCGVVGLINDQFGGFSYIQIGMTILFFVIVVIYGHLSVKAQKKFLGL